ncbi:MAG: MFS transporter [Spirochaetes bacterium]|nr:MFS transporter [Spirochaetota bacterium]
MRRYTRLFYLLALSNFLFFLGNSLYILLPVFLKNMGASESYIGFMNNIDKIFTIITAVGIGSIMHGRDRIRLLRTGYMILVVAYAAYLTVTSLTWSIILIRVMHGIGFSVAMIMGTSIIFDIVPIEDAAEAIGIYGITGALSNALSPFFGEMLLSRGHSHYLIFALSVLLVSTSLAITFIMSRGERPGPAPDEPARSGSLRLLLEPRYLLMTLASIIFGGSFGVIITYLPNFIRTATSFRFSYFFIIYICVLIIIRFTFLKIVTRINRNNLLIAVFANGALMYLLFNSLNSLPVLILTGIMYGVTHGILFPVLNTTVVSLVHMHDRGRANALFIASFNGGMMSFAFALGFLIDRFHTYLVAFNVCAVMFLLAIGLMIIMKVKYSKPQIKIDPELSIEVE